jgi:hypothetical protein
VTGTAIVRKAWPARPLDELTPCGGCGKDIIVSAYDDKRVEQHVETSKRGCWHLVCITKALRESPELLEEC